MRYISSCLMAGIAFATSAIGIGAETVSKAAPLATALDAPVISLFIPPTRPDYIYALTAQNLFVNDGKSDNWDARYPSSGDSAVLLAVSGYAKSSEVIYVVETRGIAVSHDTGAHWEINAPAGFSAEPGTFAQVAVNPTNREEAVVIAGGKLWSTASYGKDWAPLSPPNSFEEVSLAAYTGGEEARIVVAAGESLYTSKGLGQPWSLPVITGGPGAKYAAGQSGGVLYGVTAKGDVHVRHAEGEATGIYRPAVLQGGLGRMTADAAEKGLLWFSLDRDLFLLSLQAEDAKPEKLHTGSVALTNLVAHPRRTGEVLWSEGSQVYHLKLAEEAIPQQPVSTIFAQLPEAGDATPSAGVGQDDVDLLMRRLLESRPTFSEAAAAALRNADYAPEEIARWKKTVRTRNLLPQLVVESGSREWPSSVYTTQYYRNQFGVRIPEDIHRNDNIAELDNKSVSLRWDLGNLLFDADEVHISEEARSRAIDRNDLLKDVSRLYFSRAELLVKEYLTRNSTDEKSRISLKLELAETSELLNQICGSDLFDPVANPLIER